MSLINLHELLALDTDEPADYLVPLRSGDYAAAVPLLVDAAETADARAMGFLGSLCVLGQGIPRDLSQAVRWFRRGATLGDSHCQLVLGVCLANGFGIPVDLRESVDWLYRAGRKGSQDAIQVLSDVVGKNPGLVGDHFSIEEYLGLMSHLRRPAVLH